MKQAKLFELEPKKPRIKRMHMVDAGGLGGDQDIAVFKCHRCGKETDWLIVTVSEIRRGIPCDACNNQPQLVGVTAT